MIIDIRQIDTNIKRCKAELHSALYQRKLLINKIKKIEEELADWEAKSVYYYKRK